MVVYDDYSSRGQRIMSWVLICDPDKMTVNEPIRGPMGLVLKAAHGIKITETDGVRDTEKWKWKLVELGRLKHLVLVRKIRCLS